MLETVLLITFIFIQQNYLNSNYDSVTVKRNNSKLFLLFTVILFQHCESFTHSLITANNDDLNNQILRFIETKQQNNESFLSTDKELDTLVSMIHWFIFFFFEIQFIRLSKLISSSYNDIIIGQNFGLEKFLKILKKF